MAPTGGTTQLRRSRRGQEPRDECAVGVRSSFLHGQRHPPQDAGLQTSLSNGDNLHSNRRATPTRSCATASPPLPRHAAHGAHVRVFSYQPLHAEALHRSFWLVQPHANVPPRQDRRDLTTERLFRRGFSPKSFFCLGGRFSEKSTHHRARRGVRAGEVGAAAAGTSPGLAAGRPRHRCVKEIGKKTPKIEIQKPIV